MTREERNTKLKNLITCLKCEESGKECDANCHVQYEAGNMGEIIENLEAISKALEQEPCEDEYIKVPKNALKYRTAGMVVYNAEWLKNHFDIERAVICGAQQSCDVFDKYGNYKYPSDVELTEPNTATSMPCEDAISRQAAIDALDKRFDSIPMEQTTEILLLRKDLRGLPPIYPEPSSSEKPNTWTPVSERLPEFSIEVLTCSNGGFIEIQSLEKSHGGYWENQHGDLSDFDEVIAWMPLPKSYKSKESEEV